MQKRELSWYGHRGPAPFPSDDEPGSPERIATYRERVDAGFEVFHSSDRIIEWPAPRCGEFLRMIEDPSNSLWREDAV